MEPDRRVPRDLILAMIEAAGLDPYEVSGFRGDTQMVTFEITARISGKDA